jgi:hypothetical protein
MSTLSSRLSARGSESLPAVADLGPETWRAFVASGVASDVRRGRLPRSGSFVSGSCRVAWSLAGARGASVVVVEFGGGGVVRVPLRVRGVARPALSWDRIPACGD